MQGSGKDPENLVSMVVGMGELTHNPVHGQWAYGLRPANVCYSFWIEGSRRDRWQVYDTRTSPTKSGLPIDESESAFDAGVWDKNLSNGMMRSKLPLHFPQIDEELKICAEKRKCQMTLTSRDRTSLQRAIRDRRRGVATARAAEKFQDAASTRCTYVFDNQEGVNFDHDGPQDVVRDNGALNGLGKWKLVGQSESSTAGNGRGFLIQGKGHYAARFYESCVPRNWSGLSRASSSLSEAPKPAQADYASRHFQDLVERSADHYPKGLLPHTTLLLHRKNLAP
ncbi:hypothetical protein B0H19DRAFT_1061422 [Mycena capillaripes]|nr:hypothetical protein B0H19DRAFT_1061422 [Mycena capillaripes]